MYKISKTFQTITPESASQGDFSETGFIYKDKSFESLEDIISEVLSDGCLEASSSQFHSGIWYSTVDTDLYTGEETTYSFHLDGMSEFDQRRVFSALMIKCA